MPRKNPETKFKESVVEDLKTLPDAWFEKIQQVSIRGTPDFVICKAGVFIGLELKVDSELTKLQNHKLNLIKKAGGRAYSVTPKTWKRVFQEIKEIK